MTEPLPPIDPRRAALLVMDYQNGIVDMLGEPDDLLSLAANAIAIVRRAGGQVGYVRVAFEDADLESIPPTSRMGQRVGTAPQAFHNDSPNTALHDRVAPEPGDIIVRKVRVGAFSTTDLDAQLRERDIDTNRVPRELRHPEHALLHGPAQRRHQPLRHCARAEQHRQAARR